jgi:hypothetical protein
VREEKKQAILTSENNKEVGQMDRGIFGIPKIHSENILIFN